MKLVHASGKTIQDMFNVFLKVNVTIQCFQVIKTALKYVSLFP